MSDDSKKRKHTGESGTSSIWQSIRSRFLPAIISSAEPTSNANAEVKTPSAANDLPPQEKEEGTNAAKQRKVCSNDKVEDKPQADTLNASAFAVTPEKSACADPSSKPAQDVLIPRITEQMDLADLKAEAWERGYAGPSV